MFKWVKEDYKVMRKSDKIMLLAMVAVVLLFTAFILEDAYGFEADIYGGYYFDSSLRSNPNDDGRHAQWMAGLSIGETWKGVKGFYNIETLMDGYNGDGSFHPASVRYTTGLQYAVHEKLTVEVSHMCWHPVDAGGKTEQYNLVKFTYHLR